MIESSQPKSTTRSIETGSELYSAGGVDCTLIRWMLSLQPAQRLAVLQQAVDSIHRLKRETRRNQL